ncbi:MAG TPA: type I methionyl aminopeptidase [Clostridia bacterium]|nr:type I methionyl aminopeptidase [Clostridia bacterium]
MVIYKGGEELKIRLKTDREIKLMREVNREVGKLLQELAKLVRPGITTKDLDEFAEEYIRKLGAIPTFKEMAKFPGCICTSVNNQVVHGIPSPTQVLKEGDIVSIDAGMQLNGYCGDSTITVGVGEISEEKKRLLEVTKQALALGIEQCVVGNRIGDIGYAMQTYVESQGYSIVREFIGHGIGKFMHEPPEVPSFGKKGTGLELKRGLVIAVEPIVNMGDYKVNILRDGWTVVTADGSLSAQFEHTVAITNEGPQILSLPD